jgi:hypothetical protein
VKSRVVADVQAELTDNCRRDLGKRQARGGTPMERDASVLRRLGRVQFAVLL